MSVISTQGRRKIRTGALRTVLASAATLLVLSVLSCASAGAAESAVAPLPASDYTVRHVCPAPTPGYASCLALELVPKTAAARAHDQPQGVTRGAPLDAPASAEGVFVLGPEALHSVYQLPTASPAAQTIAIVDAYNDLNAEADLKVYDEEFGLPELSKCSAGEVSDCFEQVNQNGATGNPPFPASNTARAAEEVICKTAIEEETKEAACKEVEEADGWTTEISLDIEVSHAVCQNCRVVLVEADSASFSDLETAEETAAGLGATEISNSWGGAECSKGTRGTECGEDSPAFNHQGIAITAAAGDDGYLDWDAPIEGAEKGFADYPASSPHVVAVGGTRLLPLGPGGTWRGETVWNGDGAGGSGCSISFAAPAWQSAEPDWSSVGCGSGRAVADVSADADPYTGVAIYDSTPESPESSEAGWRPIGGTSLASPLIASVFALAGGAGGAAYPAETLYENEAEDPTTLHDIVSGSNGECTQPFNKEDGLSACTALQEAASCSEKAICLVREGYDGPTGVGTPNGIAAFEPVSEEAKRKTEEKRHAEKQLREEKQHEEERQREERKQEEEAAKKREEEAATKNPGEGSTTGTSTTGAGSISPAGGATGDSSGTTTLSIAAGAPTIKLTAFALTPSALLALNRARPKVSKVGFAFTLSAAARVRASIAKRVRVRGRTQWVLVPGSVTFAAGKGSDRRHLTSSNGLTPGSYRLTLTPEHGSARSITFQIG
jgi:hypothetical protein